jgi:Skp family chaperone for outer membrane proteins
METDRRTFLETGAALVWAGPQEADAPAAGGIGVVDIRACLGDKYVRAKELRGEIARRREGFAREAERLRKKMAEEESRLQHLARSDKHYWEGLRRRGYAEHDLKVLQEESRREIGEVVGDALARIHREVRRVVGRVAAEKRLQIVLWGGDGRGDKDDEEALAASLSLAPRSVLFHAETVDLTAPVLARLNDEWARAWSCPGCTRKATEGKCPDCGTARPR